MRRSPTRLLTAGLIVCCGAALGAQAVRQAASPPAAVQAVDADYTAKIRDYTVDPRILTELVDHMPASDHVPSPLKVLGRIPGTPDELTPYADIVRYFDALDRASDRVTVLRIGRSDEGRDLIMAVVADEATVAALGRSGAVISSTICSPRVAA